MLPGLDRQHAWEFKLRFSTPRPVPPAPGAPSTLPDVTFAVDGVALKTVRGTHTFQDVAITLPMVTGEKRGAAITVQVSDTFVPGPGDTRQLGMMVDELRIVRPAQGVPIIPRQAIAAAAVGGAIFGGLFGLIGLTAGSATIAVTALGIGQAVVVARGAAPYTRYIRDIPEIAAYVAIGTVILVWIVERVRNQRLRNTARFVAAFSSAALFLKLLVLLHPHMPIGDALFQAHRFEWVRDGRWFFTSIAPGGYQFPYAIGLYVAALPFDEYVHGTLRFHGAAAHPGRGDGHRGRRAALSADRRIAVRRDRFRGAPARHRRTGTGAGHPPGRRGRGRSLSPAAAQFPGPDGRQSDERVRPIAVRDRAGADRPRPADRSRQRGATPRGPGCSSSRRSR